MDLSTTNDSAVWKFPIPFPEADTFQIDMPQGTQVLTVQLQHGEPQIWALVRPQSPMSHRRFRIAGTGHPIGERVLAYVGTFQLMTGSLVFHVFEVEQP